MTHTAFRPTHDTHGLVHPLPEGPLDFVADIHGEIDALRSLLERMNYATDGSHPDGRRLVFLGDLVDRGPNSPGVVRLVRGMIDAGNAQAVLGNHELNILRGSSRANNAWFYEPDNAGDNETKLDPDERDDFMAFFASMPLALERDDIRAVHANWDTGMIANAKAARDTIDLYETVSQEIQDYLDKRQVTDKVERNLAKQNHNPVKLLTSGRETRAAKAFELDGKMRGEDRHAWWHDYADEAFVVFGHYWRKPTDPKKKALTDQVFGNTPLYALTSTHTISIDYSVGARAYERTTGKTHGFEGELAALRWPERELVFDHHDETIPLHAKTVGA